MYLLHHFIYGLKEGSEKKYIYTLKTHFSTEEWASDTILSCLPFFTFMKEGYECGWSTMWIFEARATQTDETSWMSGETTSRQSHLHKKESLSFVSIFENTTVHKLMSRFFFMLSSIMADNNCQKSLKKLTRWFLLLTVHRNWGELTSFYWSYFLCMGDVTLTQSRCYMQSMIPTHVTLLSWVKLILMYLN